MSRLADVVRPATEQRLNGRYSWTEYVTGYPMETLEQPANLHNSAAVVVVCNRKINEADGLSC